MKTGSSELIEAAQHSLQERGRPGHSPWRCELYKPGEEQSFLMQQNYRFQLLAPPHARFGGVFGRSKVNEQLYRQRLASMQALRGRVYLKDGAIQPWELDDQGRFHMRSDEQSWHFLLVDNHENTIGCARYLVHPNTVGFEGLRISHSPVARHRYWGERVRQAVECDLQRAREQDLSYVEIGGWALCEQWRGTRAALEILVASYAMAQLWGGSLGSCMATVRHQSSSILRRIGGASFQLGGETIPAYEDPYYGCTMELLRFDSRSPAQRFVPLINQLKTKVANTLMIRGARPNLWGTLASEVGAEHMGLMRLSPVYN